MTQRPDFWREVSLSELGKWVTGSTPKSSNPLNFGNDIDFVTPSDIDYGGILGVSERRISHLGASSVRLVKAPSVNLVCIGTIGKVSLANRDVTTNQQINSLEVDELVVNPKFAMWLLASPEVQEKFWANASSTTVAILNKGNLEKIKTYIPPLPEQLRIVEILEDNLSRLDVALTDVQQAKVKAAQFRSSILQSAFNRGLATEHNKSAWTTAQLSELVDIGWGDLQVTKKSYVQTGYLAYSATGADGFLPYFDYDSEGIIVSAIGANCGKIFRANGKWSCIKNTMRILPKSPSVLLDYLFHYLSDSSIFPKRGSGQPFIGQQDAREIEISFPSIAEQKKIIEFVEYSISRLDSSMKLAEEMEIQSTGLRRSLLQAAFTGQLTKEVVSV
jgi:type I restriction enzyme S subunit